MDDLNPDKNKSRLPELNPEELGPVSDESTSSDRPMTKPSLPDGPSVEEEAGDRSTDTETVDYFDEDLGPRRSLLAGTLEFFGELIHVVIISLAIIIPIRYFLIQPFYVKGASMEPSFYDHEYLIIDEISYRFDAPQRGDIVVFRYPNDPRQFFIKRIIGLPGERLVVSDGRVKIFAAGDSEGRILDESAYLGTATTIGSKDITLGPDEYFLMGDNRSASLDSRVFGGVPRDFIVGRVWFRGWPPEKIHFFTPDVGFK